VNIRRIIFSGVLKQNSFKRRNWEVFSHNKIVLTHSHTSSMSAYESVYSLLGSSHAREIQCEHKQSWFFFLYCTQCKRKKEVNEIKMTKRNIILQQGKYFFPATKNVFERTLLLRDLISLKF
jgi:hypothetical protein